MLVPEKKPEESIEVKEESGTIISFDVGGGFGFIETDGGVLVGFWLKDQKGDKSLVPGKKKQIIFKRDPKAVVIRAKEWWLVEVPAPPKTDATKPRLNPDAKFRIMRQIPGKSAAEIIFEGAKWELDSYFGLRPTQNQDPLKKSSIMGGLQCNLWFETDGTGNWERCGDPRSPFKEQRPQRSPKRKKIHRS